MMYNDNTTSYSPSASLTNRRPRGLRSFLRTRITVEETPTLFS